MTREMLGTGHDPRVLHTFHISYSEPGDFIPVFTKRTITDDRIIRVIIYINNRSIVNMYTNPLALIAHGYTHPVNQIFIIQCTQGKLVGKFNHAIQPHSESPFPINGY